MTVETNPYGVVYQEGGPGLVQVIQVPQAAPHRCATCGFSGGLRSNGTKDSRVFIDFNFTIDYYGQVIFCSDCMVNIANSIGYLSAEQAESLRDQIEFQQNELITLKDQNVHLRNAIASLTSGSDDPLVRESVVTVVDDEVRTEVIKSFKLTVDESQSETDESTPQQGPNDLSGPKPSFGPSGLLEL